MKDTNDEGEQCGSEGHISLQEPMCKYPIAHPLGFV